MKVQRLCLKSSPPYFLSLKAQGHCSTQWVCRSDWFTFRLPLDLSQPSGEHLSLTGHWHLWKLHTPMTLWILLPCPALPCPHCVLRPPVSGGAQKRTGSFRLLSQPLRSEAERSHWLAETAMASDKAMERGTLGYHDLQMLEAGTTALAKETTA